MKILYAVQIQTELLRKIGDNVENLNSTDFFLLPLIDHFWKKQNEVIIVSFDRRIKKSEVYRNAGLTIYIVKTEKHGNLSASLLFRNDIYRILGIIKKEKCDIYHAHWCYELAAACVINDPEHTIITMHDWPDKVCTMLGNYYWRRRNQMANTTIEKCLHFTAVSPYIQKHIEMVGKHDIGMIPNFFLDKEIKECFNRDNKDVFRIIAVNNGFSRLKNTNMSMKVFEKFHRSYPESEIVFWGDEYEKNGPAAKWANENLNTDGMYFMGWGNRSQLIEAYSKANVLLHLSLEESFGLIYLDAMAAKVAIIAGKDSGATPWVLQEGKSGCLVDVNDENDVIDGLMKLYLNLEYREEIINNGRERLNDFCSDMIFERYEEEYRRITKSK